MPGAYRSVAPYSMAQFLYVRLWPSHTGASGKTRVVDWTAMVAHPPAAGLGDGLLAERREDIVFHKGENTWPWLYLQ